MNQSCGRGWRARLYSPHGWSPAGWPRMYVARLWDISSSQCPHSGRRSPGVTGPSPKLWAHSWPGRFPQMTYSKNHRKGLGWALWGDS